MTRSGECVFCGDIGGDYVECVNGDDFCVVCEVECFCDGDSDAQAGETSWADGDVDVLDFFGLSA